MPVSASRMALPLLAIISACASQRTLECANFPVGATLTHIGRRDVVDTPNLIWSYLSERCRSARPVVMTVIEAGKDGRPRDVSIPCSTAVVGRPVYVEILSSRSR